MQAVILQGDREVAVEFDEPIDGVTRTPATHKPGWSGRLNLETFDANPQLKSLFVRDTLVDDFQAVVYYDSGI